MFQRAMYYAFHDIKCIVEAYLDDLVAHSKKREQNLSHLWDVFEQCHFYKICLNILCGSTEITRLHYFQGRGHG